jgi:hypothetical protein
MTGLFMSADERLALPQEINIALFGPSGIGKTTLATTLDPSTTLHIDYESGTLALRDWRGDVLDVRKSANALGADPWEFSRGLACLLAGPDPADVDGPYSRKAYDAYAARIAPAESFGKYRTIFLDSITVASRMCFSWAKRQPEAFNANGKPDTRGAYGLLGQEMVRWLTALQHTKGKSIVVVGILDRVVDDLGRVEFVPQIEGSKTGRELPGIFDEVLTLEYVNGADGKPLYDDAGNKIRGIYTQQSNPYGFPAKDRSSRLAAIERPDLGRLMQKIRDANARAAA